MKKAQESVILAKIKTKFYTFASRKSNALCFGRKTKYETLRYEKRNTITDNRKTINEQHIWLTLEK